MADEIRRAWLRRVTKDSFLWKLAHTFLSCGDSKKLSKLIQIKDIPGSILLLEKIKAAAERSGAKFNDDKYSEFLCIIGDGKNWS